MTPRRTRMTREQTLRLLECFVAGTPARQAADVAGVNRNTARLCYHHVREIIALHLGSAEPWRLDTEPSGLDSTWDSTSPAPLAEALLHPHIEGDYQVVPLAGLIEHLGHVQVVALPDLAGAPGAGGAARPIQLDAVVCVDEAVDDAAPPPERQGRLHIEMRADIPRESARCRAIRSFWRKSAHLLRRYNGVPRERIFLYLKECEWRFSEGSHEASLATLSAWFTPLH